MDQAKAQVKGGGWSLIFEEEKMIFDLWACLIFDLQMVDQKTGEEIPEKKEEYEEYKKQFDQYCAEVR